MTPEAQRAEQIQILERLARDWRRAADIIPPRDYVPTAKELADEQAPQLATVSALLAGADALRQQKEKQQRPICADGFHKAESLDSPHRRCVNCGHEWVFPAASNLPAAERSSPAGLPARLQDARGTLMAAIGRFRVSGQLDPVTDAVDAYEALYQPSPVGLAAILREYQAQHKDDCAEMATCPDCRYRFNQCGHFDHCGPYQPSCTCGLAALITPSGEKET